MGLGCDLARCLFSVLETLDGDLHLIEVNLAIEFFHYFPIGSPFGELGSKLCKLRMSILKGLFDVLYACERYLDLVVINVTIQLFENRHNPGGADDLGGLSDSREGGCVYPWLGIG